MLRNKLISRLVKEGFTHKTLSTFTDPQLKQLATKVIKEVQKSTVQKTTYSKSEVDQMKSNHGGLSVDDGTVTPHEDGSVTVTQEMSEDNIEYDTDNMGNRDVEIDDRDLLRDDEELDEAAVSKAQKRFYCYVKACKESKYKDCGTGTDIIDAAKSTTMKEINKYCSTSEKGLPEKITETFESWVRHLVEEDKKNTIISKKSLMEIIRKNDYHLDYNTGTVKPKQTDLFDSLEQEVAFDRLNKMVLKKKGYELKIDELEKGEDQEESVLLMYLNSPTGHVWDIAIFTDGNIYMDNAPIDDEQDLEEEIREKESRREGELAETERDSSGEYIGAPVATQSPTTVPVKPGIKSPPKPKRPGPFKRPKTTPKPKAGKKNTPDWFSFDGIKADVEKKK